MVSPLRRLAKDKKALKWLKDHQAEFGGLNQSLPQFQAYPRAYLLEQGFIADLIKQAIPFRNAFYTQVAELFLVMPPRKIALQLGVRRKRVYDALCTIKRLARTKWEQDREALLNARAKATRQFDTHPKYIALRTLELTHGEVTKHAYLLEGGRWVDEDGKPFTAEIADILDNHATDLANSEAVHAEEI